MITDDVILAIMASSDKKKLKHCVFCSEELKTTKSKAYCHTCSDEPKKFSVSKEISTDEVEKKFKDLMVYCYNCGEELERRIWCPECEQISIYMYNNVPKPSESLLSLVLNIAIF